MQYVHMLNCVEQVRYCVGAVRSPGECICSIGNGKFQNTKLKIEYSNVFCGYDLFRADAADPFLQKLEEIMLRRSSTRK